MTTYTVSGTNRQVGAIGAMEPFIETVEATDPREAKEKARDERYLKGYEHVLCTGVNTPSTRLGPKEGA